MNWTSISRFTMLLGLGLTLPCTFLRPSLASEFTETAIEQIQVIAVARPYGTETTKYDLLVIEQIPDKKQCWQTSGATPALVDPLLLNYDFTGHCRRATDSNGYSVRIDGQDYGLEYLLRLVPRDNELVLVATSRTGKAPELVLGSTKGIASGFMQVQLNPGWQFTKRTYQGKVLGHFYICGSQASLSQPTTPASASSEGPEPVSPDPVQPDPVQPDPVQPSLPPVSNDPQVPNQAVMVEESTNAVANEILESPPVVPRPVPPRSNRRPIPTPDSFRGI
ncbi:MAG: DUF3747 domain-containing protein [Prochlorothrix sp.]